MANAFPLQWPQGRARWKLSRSTSKFRMTDGQMLAHLMDELDRLSAKDVVISTNRGAFSRAQPADPGVAVYFKRKDRDLCIACDRYSRVEDNLHAIGLAVEAIRALERHGTGDMVDAAFSGFTALPESVITPPPSPWWQVLGIDEHSDKNAIKAAYKSKVKYAHPDTGGNSVAFARLQKAYEEGMARHA